MQKVYVVPMFGAILAAVAACAGAFWHGLYAPGQQLLLVVVAAVLGAGSVRLTRLEWGASGLLAFGALASLASPAARGTAAHGPLIAGGWLLAMAAGRRFGCAEWPVRWLSLVWGIAGALMTFAGVAALPYLPEHHSGRLAAFLGYPIAVGVLGMLGLAGALPALRERRWYAAVLAFGSAAGLLLSGSRGVWAVAVLLALYLAWARPELLRRAGWPVAGALAAALWAGPAVAARQSVPALAAMFLACLTVVLVDRFPRGWPLAAVGTVFALALAPGWNWFLGRATALPLTEGSSVERLAFLQDGLRLAVQWPLGAGLKAWTPLHLQGASYGYYSAEVHSALLDMALAFGWAGALGFLLLLARFGLGLLGARGWSAERVAVLGGLGALGLHALVDWDLSFGVFAFPLWFGFGLLAPSGVTKALPRWGGAALASLLLAGVVLVGAGDVAVMAAEGALERNSPIAAQRHATFAVTINPWSDQAHAALGRAYSHLGQREAAIASLEQARRLGPYEPWYAELQARELIAAARWEEGAAAYREFVRLWPWEVAAYEAALEAHLDMLLRLELMGRPEVASRVAESGRQILGALDRQKAQEPPGRPRRPMQIDTPVIRQARQYFFAGGNQP